MGCDGVMVLSASPCASSTSMLVDVDVSVYRVPDPPMKREREGGGGRKRREE